VFSCLVGRDRQRRADHVPFPCGASEMTAQAPDLVAADLAKLITLAIMYGATWRHTYRKHLRALAARPGGRIRVVLPDPSPGSRVAALYAATLRTTPDDFCGRVSEAIDDFHSMGPPRHVEVYLTSAAFRHAIYLFSQQAVLAMYALCSERIPTPALLASEGRLLSFIREDFDRLLDQSDRVT